MNAECPYCGKDQEICHDDGYGYDEDKTYLQECGSCEKTFTFQTVISFDYTTGKAPCQNGESHDWEKIHGCPEEFFKYKRRCSYCDEEKVIDTAAHMKEIEKFHTSLKLA